MNLLTETIQDIKDSGHSVKDVTFVGSSDGEYSCSWEEFKRLADRDYDSGYGAPEVATDLIIAFTDGSTMWRSEYDGSERWEFSAPFVKPDQSKPIETLFSADRGSVGWDTLKELHG